MSQPTESPKYKTNRVRRTGTALWRVLCLSAVGFLAWKAVGCHRFTPAGFDQITPGMTQGEVHRLLGRPPGDYRLNKLAAAPSPTRGFDGKDGPNFFHQGGRGRQDWLADGRSYEVYYDAQGRVVATYLRRL